MNKCWPLCDGRDFHIQLQFNTLDLEGADAQSTVAVLYKFPGIEFLHKMRGIPAWGFCTPDTGRPTCRPLAESNPAVFPHLPGLANPCPSRKIPPRPILWYSPGLATRHSARGRDTGPIPRAQCTGTPVLADEPQPAVLPQRPPSGPQTPRYGGMNILANGNLDRGGCRCAGKRWGCILIRVCSRTMSALAGMRSS